MTFENREFVSVSFVLFSLCLALVVHLHLLSFEVEFITVNGDHAHRAHDLSALRLGGPTENIIQAVVPVGVSLHWLSSCGGPRPLLLLNGLNVFKGALTVFLLLIVLSACLLFSGGSRGSLASLHDIINDLTVSDEDIASWKGGIRLSNSLLGGHTKLVTLATTIVFCSVIVVLRLELWHLCYF